MSHSNLLSVTIYFFEISESHRPIHFTQIFFSKDRILKSFQNFDIKTLNNRFGTNFGRYEGANPSSCVTDSRTCFLKIRRPKIVFKVIRSHLNKISVATPHFHFQNRYPFFKFQKVVSTRTITSKTHLGKIWFWGDCA